METRPRTSIGKLRVWAAISSVISGVTSAVVFGEIIGEIVVALQPDPASFSGGSGFVLAMMTLTLFPLLALFLSPTITLAAISWRQTAIVAKNLGGRELPAGLAIGSGTGALTGALIPVLGSLFF
jgi:hypothetical protein